MSQYTTGELAKACNVTVRTVQYYDGRGILVPSALTEGGRRLYSEDDLKKMKIICFLRETGLSLDTIGQLMAEEDPGSVIEVIIEQQEQVLKDEIAERRGRLFHGSPSKPSVTSQLSWKAKRNLTPCTET